MASDANYIHRLVKEAFAIAWENRPSIIFIEEIDALCSPPGQLESDTSLQIKQEIVTQIDGTGRGVFVLATPSVIWQLDSSVVNSIIL